MESYKSVGAVPTNAPVAPATSSQVTTAPEPTSVDTNATGAASVQLPTNPANVPAASTAPVNVAHPLCSQQGVVAGTLAKNL